MDCYYFFGFPSGVRYPHWSPTKFGFAPGSPTLGGKALPNKGDSVPKGNRTRDLLVKDEGVLTTPPQPLLVINFKYVSMIICFSNKFTN